MLHAFRAFGEESYMSLISLREARRQESVESTEPTTSQWVAASAQCGRAEDRSGRPGTRSCAIKVISVMTSVTRSLQHHVFIYCATRVQDAVFARANSGSPTSSSKRVQI